MSHPNALSGWNVSGDHSDKLIDIPKSKIGTFKVPIFVINKLPL